MGAKINLSTLLVVSVLLFGVGYKVAPGRIFYVAAPSTQEKCGGANIYPDGYVNLNDFAIFAQYWLESNCAASHDCGGADLVYDNAVDTADLVRFTANWLCELGEILNVDLTMGNLWMYQNLPGATGSRLVANVLVNYDALSNSSYSYEWEFVLPSDVNVRPATVNGGEPSDAFWAFAAPRCDEPNGLPDLGEAFVVRVTVTGNDYGNTAVAQREFGVALLGDVNNDCVVDVVDCSIINAFWRYGSAGPYSLRDCDVNCDGIVDVADRSVANAVWRGMLGENKVTNPCPLR